MEINVEWSTFSRPRDGWRSGCTFKDHNDVTCRWTPQGRECINWREYARWHGDNYPTPRVWINGDLVYYYERGWLVDIDTYQPKQYTS